MFKSVIEFVLIVNWLIASCIKGRGRYYQGNVSTTVSGLQCQRWDSQRPHSHNRPPLHIFPEMQGAENFCRNAGGQEPRPWCYTQDPLVRWQHCHIPQCGTIRSETILLLSLLHISRLSETLPYFPSRSYSRLRPLFNLLNVTQVLSFFSLLLSLLGTCTTRLD